MGNIWVKGLLLWEKEKNEKNEVLSAELGGNRESGAEDSKLDGETGLSGSSKKRSYRSEPFFFWKKISIHCFLM